MEATVLCLRVLLLCISYWQNYIWPKTRGRNAGLTALLMSPLALEGVFCCLRSFSFLFLAFEDLFTSEVIMHLSCAL